MTEACSFVFFSACHFQRRREMGSCWGVGVGNWCKEEEKNCQLVFAFLGWINQTKAESVGKVTKTAEKVAAKIQNPLESNCDSHKRFEGQKVPFIRWSMFPHTESHHTHTHTHRASVRRSLPQQWRLKNHCHGNKSLPRDLISSFHCPTFLFTAAVHFALSILLAWKFNIHTITLKGV